MKTCCHSRVQVFAHGQCSGSCRVGLRCGRASRVGTVTSSHSARQLTLHLPTDWPWQTAWEQMAAAANRPPLAT